MQDNVHKGAPEFHPQFRACQSVLDTFRKMSKTHTDSNLSDISSQVIHSDDTHSDI